jgi:hypothetical protein
MNTTKIAHQGKLYAVTIVAGKITVASRSAAVRYAVEQAYKAAQHIDA